jgi:deoxyhypusine synthase
VKDYLKKAVKPVSLETVRTISELISAFNYTSFQSRRLARCVEIFISMLEDQDRPTIFLGFAGAMVPAGIGGVVVTMVNRRMVDVVVSTGANMYHDLFEALGESHYIGSTDVDDRLLYEMGIDRIFDTFADEEKFREIDKRIEKFAAKLALEEDKNISSRYFLYKLGEFIENNGLEEKKKNSIIWNCWKERVPIFVPALNDSALGLALTQHYVKAADNGSKTIVIDGIKDNYEIFKIKKTSKKTGVIYVGGGVPKNYIQQTAYLQGIFGIPDSGHCYGIQITTDGPEWGGLSGCTFREGISWGKEKPEGRFVTCYCDATIALPLIVKATLERCRSLESRDKVSFKL